MFLTVTQNWSMPVVQRLQGSQRKFLVCFMQISCHYVLPVLLRFNVGLNTFHPLWSLMLTSFSINDTFSWFSAGSNRLQKTIFIQPVSRRKLFGPVWGIFWPGVAARHGRIPPRVAGGFYNPYGPPTLYFFKNQAWDDMLMCRFHTLMILGFLGWFSIWWI